MTRGSRKNRLKNQLEKAVMDAEKSVTLKTEINRLIDDVLTEIINEQ